MFNENWMETVRTPNDASKICILLRSSINNSPLAHWTVERLFICIEIELYLSFFSTNYFRTHRFSISDQIFTESENPIVSTILKFDISYVTMNENFKMITFKLDDFFCFYHSVFGLATQLIVTILTRLKSIFLIKHFS